METTLYGFISNVRSFLSHLIKDPLNTKVNDYLKERGMSKPKLINILLKRDVIRRHESIIDPEKEGDFAKYNVKYNVVRKNFERKLKRIYNKYFENKRHIESGDMEECTSCGASSGAYSMPLFGKPIKRTLKNEGVKKSRNIYITEKQYAFLKETLSTSNAGNYQYTVPFPVKKNDPTLIHRKKGGISMEKIK